MALFGIFSRKSRQRETQRHSPSRSATERVQHQRDFVTSSSLKNAPREDRPIHNLSTGQKQTAQSHVKSHQRPPRQYHGYHHTSHQPPLSCHSNQRSNRESESRPKHPNTAQAGPEVSNDVRKVQRSANSGTSTQRTGKRNVSQPASENSFAKGNTLYDHFPSTRSDPVANHPAHRPPPLPPRPDEQKRATPDMQSRNAIDRSPSSSSATSTSTSSSESVATKATTIVPEDAIPSNPEQETLRRLKSLGFAEDRCVHFPKFGGLEKTKSPIAGQPTHSFTIDKQTLGYVSPNATTIRRKKGIVSFPRNTTVSAIVEFEAKYQHRHRLSENTTRIILRHLLMSEEIQPVDVPYVLPCFYWIKTHLSTPHIRIPPVLRVQCNERQRRLFRVFNSIPSEDHRLAKALTGVDDYDNSVRLCAFLELFVEESGPFDVSRVLDKIKRGRKSLKYGDPKLDHLAKASLNCIGNLIATIVHSLGQHLATDGCRARQMQDVADAVSLILLLSGEREVGKIFYVVLPRLVAGEVALCYALLLATGLADEADTDELWRLLVGKMLENIHSHYDDTSMAISAIVVVLYSSGEGGKTLFPGLYRELWKRNFPSPARRAWVLLGGDGHTWDAIVQETLQYWSQQMYFWDNREAIIDTSWREQMAREAAQSAAF